MVDAVQSEYSLDVINYSSETELTQAAGRGDIYGGYIPGSSSDTLAMMPNLKGKGIYLGDGGAEGAGGEKDALYDQAVEIVTPFRLEVRESTSSVRSRTPSM